MPTLRADVLAAPERRGADPSDGISETWRVGSRFKVAEVDDTIDRSAAVVHYQRRCGALLPALRG